MAGTKKKTFSIQKASIAGVAPDVSASEDWVTPASPAPEHTSDEPAPASAPREKFVTETWELAPEEIAPWNPRVHSFAGEVVEVEPGVRLVYEHQTSVAPVVWRFVGALALGWLAGLFVQQTRWGVILALSAIGVVELVRWKTGRYEPVRWVWDWPARTLTEVIGDERFLYDFDEVDEVVVEVSRTEHRWSSYLSGSGRQHRFYSFNAHTSLVGPDEVPMRIASTGEMQQHPDVVLYEGLCFAYMLAHQLGVPLRILAHPGLS